MSISSWSPKNRSLCCGAERPLPWDFFRESPKQASMHSMSTPSSLKNRRCESRVYNKVYTVAGISECQQDTQTGKVLKQSWDSMIQCSLHMNYIICINWKVDFVTKPSVHVHHTCIFITNCSNCIYLWTYWTLIAIVYSRAYFMQVI